MVKTNIQTFTGEVEILSNLHVGDYLTANGEASNVLDVSGNVGATFFVGDGGLISNIATNLSDIVDQGNLVANVVQFNAPPAVYGGVGFVTASNVGIQNANPLNTLSIANKIIIDKDVSEPSTTMNVHGKVYATRFEGDGGLLSNIATTLESIINQGNVSANVVQFNSATDYAGAGIITRSNVGVQNTAPVFNLSVGSNLHVNDEGSNVLTIHGNVATSNLNLGVFTVSPSHGLDQVCAESNTVTRPVRFSNVITAISAVSNIESAGTFISTDAERGIDVASNIDIGGRLKFDSNVFIDTLRVADVASNIVTYDRATGELTDSSGTFMNKFAVVSEQPPSDFFANTTTVTNHGTYTLTTSNLAANSNTFNAFDGTANAWVSGGLAGGYIGGANVFHENNLTQLSNVHPTKFGDWLAIEFPYKTTLRHMKLTPLTAGQFPENANLYATNNDVTWSEIKYWEGIVPASDTAVQTITVDATEQFKKYALVATRSVDSSNVAIKDWQLFTESFSIDGGKVAMAQQAATGGETVMDQSGPHGRGEAKLKKYPDIVFEDGKFDFNDSTNTYIQAGYTLIASTVESNSRAPWKVFNNQFSEGNGWRGTGSYSTSDGSFTGTFMDFTNGGQTIATADRGEWLKITLPKKIKLNHFILQPRNSPTDGGNGVSYGRSEFVKDGAIWGSNDGSSWSKIYTINATLPLDTSFESFIVSNSTIAYNNFVLVVTKTQGAANGAGANGILTSLSEWKLYGYEEDPPLGDTSVDTTFKSIMNTPQTTGANVYVDGSLGETFTNRVPGLLDSNISNTHTTYVSGGKYWELSGNVESNVTVEANTFLEGDQPHSLSIWFNSSNLVSNVSNSCIFSLGTEEKLDSVNLDLQSNTWHNLTYAYQGEDGSRVTYLDGRKVAEDRAEDTFGQYPPFAMTGYSQGGYVLSVDADHDGTNKIWKAFADSGSWFSHPGSGDANSSYQAGYARGNTGQSVTDTNGTTHSGSWGKIEFPHKFVLSYIQVHGGTPVADYIPHNPDNYVILGSNDDTNWDLLTTRTGASDSSNGMTTGGTNIDLHAVNATKGYKYIKFLVTKLGSTSGDREFIILRLKLYGHLGNDLVHLPDPTNVLKYPRRAINPSDSAGDNRYINRFDEVSTTSEFSTNGGTYSLAKAFDNIDGAADIYWSASKRNSPSGNLGRYAHGAHGAYNGETPTGKSFIPSNATAAQKGEWIKMKSYNKLKLNKIELLSLSTTHKLVPSGVLIWGSDNDSNWTLLKEHVPSGTGGAVTYSSRLGVITVNSTVAYKYHAMVMTHMNNSDSDYTLMSISQIKFYGTGVDSIPIQIGGGNIDKVANFRIYDRFVGEDQALEIWNAQKEEFGRAKPQMVLQQGKLGIGTDAPQGSLSVADEPHNLEEFPPRGIHSTGSITPGNSKVNIDGHGTYEVLYSITDPSHFNSATDNPLVLFDKNANTGVYSQVNTYRLNSAGTTGSSVGSGNPLSDPAIYTGSNSHGDQAYRTLGGYGGIWYGLKFPYKVNLKESHILPRGDGLTTTPNTAVFLGSEDGGLTWTKIGEFSGASWKQYEYNKYTLSHTKPINAVAIVITHSNHYYATNIGELKFFGTREQGQSVLHDGQLTLTKNLTVPRIGPALDADDTPRRDRLLIEYNTSTNPTFEGVVKDTSGRGNHGLMVGSAYKIDQKALEFVNSPTGTTPAATSYLYRDDLGNTESGNFNHSVSLWFKLSTEPNSAWRAIFEMGPSPRANTKDIGLYVTNNSSNWLAFTSGGSSLYAGGAPSGVRDGTYYHIVIVYDGAKKYIYLNGTLSNSGTYNSFNGVKNMTLQMGRNNATGLNEGIDGCVSNFKMYINHALTPQEVKTLYNMGRCDEGHHTMNISKTRVGIGLGDGEVPSGDLDVRGHVCIGPNVVPKSQWFNPALTIIQHSQGRGNGRPGAGIQFGHINEPGHGWMMGTDNDTTSGAGTGNELVWEHLSNGLQTGYGAQLSSGYAINTINDFTGQHRCFIKDIPFSQASDLEGLIVSSDQNKYIKMSGGIEAGSNAITTNESLPVVSLSNVMVDKKCFGVISASEDPEQRVNQFGNIKTFYPKEKGDTRVHINSVGEGAIWVVNTNGSLESGDYITTSNVVGYGQKQDDDALHNYTVAKITMDCDFNPATQPVQQILRSNVVETYYLGNVHHTKNVPHEFVTTTVTADDAWSNVLVSPSDVTYAEGSNVWVLPPDVTYAEWSNLEANTQNTYTLTYTQTSNVVYDTKYTLTTEAIVSESDSWNNVYVFPPTVTYAEWSNLEANTQNTYTLTFTQTTRDTKTPEEWSALESNTQTLYNKVYYQSVEEEVAATWPGAVAHTRVTDRIENELDAHGQIQWENHPTETEKAYKLRYLTADGTQTDEANAVHIAAFVGCTYHCG